MATKPTIKSIIDHFLSIVMEQDNEQAELGELISSLDELAYSVRFAEYNFDETKYPDPPETDYQTLRSAIEKRFPTLDWYNMATHIAEQTKEAELFQRDAVDDLIDIVSDLQKVAWRFDHTSKDDALWHLRFGYTVTWGRTLRFLQLYLHDFWW